MLVVYIVAFIRMYGMLTLVGLVVTFHAISSMHLLFFVILIILKI